jgi:hypothetical protein
MQSESLGIPPNFFKGGGGRDVYFSFWIRLFLILPLDCWDLMDFDATIFQSFLSITIPHQTTRTQEVEKCREIQLHRTTMLSTILEVH